MMKTPIERDLHQSLRGLPIEPGFDSFMDQYIHRSVATNSGPTVLHKKF